ncbi:MAG TPA: S53 family peptidase [Anaerolineales bacterium]|nr:S53 family peptidase [Anaerolineales bacterium]
MPIKFRLLSTYIGLFSVLLLILFSLGLSGTQPVRAKVANTGSQAAAPLIPHPYNLHKPVCPLTTEPGTVRCNAEVVTDAAGQPMVAADLLTGSYGPQAFRGAYGVSGSSATTRTVAIVDAYDDPTVLSDLDTYSNYFGIPTLNHCPVSTGTAASPCIQKSDENGGTNYPPSDSGWSEEIALDVEVVHAVCQNCNILLIEAASNYDSDLITAADQQAFLMGANVVSNSWGGSEGLFETGYDSTYNHPGVAYVFSSGDGGYGVEYPAASPYVTAVGGTTLKLNTDYTYYSETAWSGAGSGCSAYEAKPGYQHDSGCSKRTVADVSADADPNTGAAVYLNGSWWQIGGTSLAAPIISAIFAQAGGVGSTLGNSLPYTNLSYGINLRDVTSGSNGTCSGSYLCNAVKGYDGPTGLGTPLGLGAFTPLPVYIPLVIGN